MVSCLPMTYEVSAESNGGVPAEWIWLAIPVWSATATASPATASVGVWTFFFREAAYHGLDEGMGFTPPFSTNVKHEEVALGTLSVSCVRAVRCL